MIHDNDINELAIISGLTIQEKINERYPHVVYKGIRTSDQQQVIVKTLIDQYPKKEDLASIQREFRIANEMQFDGIIEMYELVPYGQKNLAIVMEKFGISLREYIKGLPKRILPLKEFFELSINIVEVLGKMHDQNIIHKDLVPNNILIDPDSWKVKIIDFDSSSELSRERQKRNLSEQITGSLPYISPEQTGRMNRHIDYRTDYYALGITFFQLLTGRLPFKAKDPLEWVHCHISRLPPSLSDIIDDIPIALSNIVSKMMAKNAEERYQSSFGLKADLERCKKEWESGSQPINFSIAELDISSNFQIPQKLYGRENELEQLALLFENATNGNFEFCLVSGYSGVGKSVLVHELDKLIVEQQGYLIHGKFDQFRQNSAYIALVDAFRDLVRQLLGESEARLAEWNIKIRKALGTNAQLLIDLVPELQMIIGPQSEVHNLPPIEAQNRFSLLLLNFVKVFATQNHPFVIILDDLQWSDIPTLNFINKLATTQDIGNLLIIGTYRDNEVSVTHPLSITLDEISKKRSVQNLKLKPLNRAAIDQLTSETLKCDPKRSEELSKVIYERAGGNPFFTLELLKNLHDQKVIHFDSIKGMWNWDLTAVKQEKYSDNVVDILVDRQSRLSETTQQALQLAACIGATFDLETLSVIRSSTMEQTGRELYEALKANLVIPLDEHYKFISEEKIIEGDKKESGLSNFAIPRYKFQHDRVQQAAYSMIGNERRKALHLSIGRQMMMNKSLSGQHENIIEIVSHLNKGKSLVNDPKEKKNIAILNLRAGIKAKQSSAYFLALEYLIIGQSLLDDNIWESDFELAWTLSEEIQHCYYLTGDWDNAEIWTEELLKKARTHLEKAEVLANRTRQYATIGKMKASITAAIQGLEILGFQFIANPTSQHVHAERELISKNLNGQEISSLISAPDLTDPAAQIASQLLMEIFPAAFLSGSGEMFPYLVLKSVNLALTFGNSPETAFAYSAYGMILCGYFEDTKLGNQYGRLGVELIDKYEDISLKSRIIYVYTMFVHHWSNHWSTMTPWFRKGIETGYQSGDLLYLAYSAQDCIIWDPQLDLETASAEQQKFLAIVKDCDYQDSYDSGTLFLQMQLNFMGRTEDKFSMTDESFNEVDCLEGMRQRQFKTGIANYHIYKAEIYLLYNDPVGALNYLLEPEQLTTSVMSLPQLVRYHIVQFLTRSALVIEMDKKDQVFALEKMQFSLDKMTKWSKQCEANFEHLRLLMEAELASLNGTMQDALQLYNQSIAKAAEHKFQRDEAMANERLANYLIRLGFRKAADGYLQASHYLFYLWSAYRKVEEMEARYPGLKGALDYQQKRASGPNVMDQASLQTNTFASQLDIRSVFKASQSISGELVLENLIKSTLNLLIENAGAEKGYLLEQQGATIFIQAFAKANNNEVNDKIIVNDQIVDGKNLPLTIINTVLRTNKFIVIRNASKPNEFSSDPYIEKNKPLSVMCVPLPKRGQKRVAIYLENNLTHSAFTKARVKVIQLLASQASISIENATIYESQEKLLKAQERFVPRQFLNHLGHKDIAKVKLGESVSMNMSVLFSDIRDFTPLVESLSAQEVIKLLNRYYGQLGEPIARSGGFIDSYAGDQMMALFAVPAQNAVQAGINISEALRQFNHDTANDNFPMLKIGMGMNTGPLVLGTMGGEDRMQCSVIGDTVNLASRIEQLTKVYNAQFVIAEQTYEALSQPQNYSVRLVDYVAVKGKQIAVKLYEILDAELDQRRKAKESTRQQHQEGLDLYFNRNFEQAYDLYCDLIKQDPEDNVFSVFAERCKRYSKNPPTLKWQGFEILERK